MPCQTRPQSVIFRGENSPHLAFRAVATRPVRRPESGIQFPEQLLGVAQSMLLLEKCTFMVLFSKKRPFSRPRVMISVMRS